MPPTEQGRHMVMVPVSGELLLQIFTQDNVIHARCVDGLPEDAGFVGLNHVTLAYGDCPTWQLVFEHPSFPLTPEGQLLPVKMIVYEAIYANPDA
jgi:hypothetical protein